MCPHQAMRFFFGSAMQPNPVSYCPRLPFLTDGAFFGRDLLAALTIIVDRFIDELGQTDATPDLGNNAEPNRTALHHSDWRRG